ncbi:recombinase family protein [Alkalihalobacillus sp. MEB130]|uniref:recombinase family protein n=1 Tax=Alkalihalobacillus sp. MEB130 TaxID=2976704 RepID=UPI0028DF9F73|nr:recombinase family protein [Alkalihalobacillus sp. MEB130]MDT8861151.1 recombinase family protein [Alkalihalobacillus sp. MEB130]
MLPSFNRNMHVAMYLRISQEKRSENFETLTNHRKILTELATRNGYTFETYEEVLSGGTSDLDQRPQLQKLLREIEKFDAILVVELSRLSRNGLISETVLQYCKDYDKVIITPEKIYDLANNDHDVLTFRFGALIASQEHALIGKRSKNNKMQMAKTGLYISGSPPFGYRRNPETKKLEIHEEEAKTVRYIYSLYSEGKGIFKIRDRLNAEGYKSATGNHFNIPSIKRIICNPVYKGWTVFTDRKKIKKHGKFVHETNGSIICENSHPAIIEESVWNDVNKAIEIRSKSSVNTREKPALNTGVTVLKDLLYCSECGRKMVIRNDKKSNMYMIKKCEYLTNSGEKCGNSGIKLEYVEKNVLQYIQSYKQDLKTVLKLMNLEIGNTAKDELKYRLNKIEIQRKKVEVQKKKLIDLAVSGIFSHIELLEKNQDLKSQLAHLDLQREKLQCELNEMSTDDRNSQLKEILLNIETMNEIQDSELLNETLKIVIKKIYYSRVMPSSILEKSTRNEERKNFPFQLKLEYY